MALSLHRAAASAQGPVGMLMGYCNSYVRGISSSAGLLSQGAPTYTYTPPGSSVTDPAYAQQQASGDGSSAQPLPDSPIMRPSKKAQWLRMSTRHSRELESQSQKPGAMLPPGCSMSDPHYSIRDPVYFHDGKQ